VVKIDARRRLERGEKLSPRGPIPSVTSSGMRNHIPASAVPASEVPPSAADAVVGEPVTANQVPSEPTTKTTGARQGFGSVSFARIAAEPVAVAVAGCVLTFVCFGAPLASGFA
jgi:hypothetical protein